jgi:hypothetical protein
MILVATSKSCGWGANFKTNAMVIAIFTNKRLTCIWQMLGRMLRLSNLLLRDPYGIARTRRLYRLKYGNIHKSLSYMENAIYWNVFNEMVIKFQAIFVVMGHYRVPSLDTRMLHFAAMTSKGDIPLNYRPPQVMEPEIQMMGQLYDRESVDRQQVSTIYGNQSGIKVEDAVMFMSPESEWPEEVKAAFKKSIERRHRDGLRLPYMPER